MSCGIEPMGLEILSFLQKRGSDCDLKKFEKIWNRRVNNLSSLLEFLIQRDLILITRDGRTKVIRIYNRAKATNCILEHEYLIPTHHKHQTQLQY